jgi:hypothetical protein
MKDLKSRDVTSLPPYRNLAPRFTSIEEGYKREITTHHCRGRKSG